MAAIKVQRDCLDSVKLIRDTLDVINGKWKLPIMLSLMVGNERFKDIQESVPGISPKILANELKELEQHLLIKRTIIDDYPIKIVYRPEPYADTLYPILSSLKEWGLNHRKKIFDKGYVEVEQEAIETCLTEDNL